MPIVKFTRRSPRTVFTSRNDFSPFSAFDDVDSRVRAFLAGESNPLDAVALPQAMGWSPSTEIVETPEELVLTAEFPGMDRKDIDISVDDGVLTLSGEKSAERKDEDKKTFLVWERSYGSFQRSFTLPRSVDTSKISAEFTQGVLKVRMPKSAEAKSKGRKIEIETK